MNDNNNNGYDFLLQDKLKTYCKENHINFNLNSWLLEGGLTHEQLLASINYCSNGNYQQAVKNITWTVKLRDRFILAQSNSFYKIIDAGFKLIQYFWKASFIKTKAKYEGVENYKLVFHRSLRILWRRLKELMLTSNDKKHIFNYLRRAMSHYKESSNRIHGMLSNQGK